MDQLEDFRKSIDIIDDSIVELLAKRLRIVRKIGKLKKKKGIPLLDKKRRNEILSSKMAKAKSLEVDSGLIKKIYNIIHEFALKLESEI